MSDHHKIVNHTPWFLSLALVVVMAVIILLVLFPRSTQPVVAPENSTLKPLQVHGVFVEEVQKYELTDQHRVRFVGSFRKNCLYRYSGDAGLYSPIWSKDDGLLYYRGRFRVKDATTFTFTEERCDGKPVTQSSGTLNTNIEGKYLLYDHKVYFTKNGALRMFLPLT